MESAFNRQFVESMIAMLDEAYLGGPETGPTWFMDHGRAAGLFGFLEQVSAAEASLPVRDGGSTVAAHTEHLRWSLAYANCFYRGERPPASWAESWGTINEVTPETWRVLQHALRAEFDTARAAILASSHWSEPNILLGTLSLAPHAAYHIGAIKQMVLTLRDRR